MKICTKVIMNPPKTCNIHLEVLGQIDLWFNVGLSGRKEVEEGAGDARLWRRTSWCRWTGGSSHLPGCWCLISRMGRLASKIDIGLSILATI